MEVIEVIESLLAMSTRQGDWAGMAMVMGMHTCKARWGGGELVWLDVMVERGSKGAKVQEERHSSCREPQ